MNSQKRASSLGNLLVFDPITASTLCLSLLQSTQCILNSADYRSSTSLIYFMRPKMINSSSQETYNEAFSFSAYTGALWLCCPEPPRGTVPRLYRNYSSFKPQPRAE
jgi:hypothetical protein